MSATPSGAQPGAESPPEEPQVSSERVWAIFGGLMLAMLLAALDQTIVATALPTIVGDLGGAEHLSWVVTAYMLASTVVTPLWGKLGDLYGRKTSSWPRIVIFLVGSALVRASRRPWSQLIVFRAIQGVGGGGLMVAAQAIIGDVVPPRERGRYQGIFGAVFGVAERRRPAARRLLRRPPDLALGLLHQPADRRRSRSSSSRAMLPARPRRVAHTIDYLGAALLGDGAQRHRAASPRWAARLGWGSAPIVGARRCSRSCALVAFVLVERRARRAGDAAAAVPQPGLLGRPAWSASSSASRCSASITYLPLYLQVVHGREPHRVRACRWCR